MKLKLYWQVALRKVSVSSLLLWTLHAVLPHVLKPKRLHPSAAEPVLLNLLEPLGPLVISALFWKGGGSCFCCNLIILMISFCARDTRRPAGKSCLSDFWRPFMRRRTVVCQIGISLLSMDAAASQPSPQKGKRRGLMQFDVVSTVWWHIKTLAHHQPNVIFVALMTNWRVYFFFIWALSV